MGTGSDPTRPDRVLALLAPGASPPEAPEPVEFVLAKSAYEAAAELLAAPASALLVHMGRITPPHVPLLDLAARLEVPVLAFGTISAPLSSAQLAGMRMVGPDQLADALKEILAESARGAAPATGPAQPRTGREIPSPAKPGSPAQMLTRAELEALLEENP